MIQIIKLNWNFRKNCNCCHKANLSNYKLFSKTTWRWRKKKKVHFQHQNLLPSHLNQNLKACQNQIHPNEQRTSYSLNYSSRKHYRNHSNSRNRYQSPRFSSNSANRSIKTLVQEKITYVWQLVRRTTNSSSFKLHAHTTLDMCAQKMTSQ